MIVELSLSQFYKEQMSVKCTADNKPVQVQDEKAKKLRNDATTIVTTTQLAKIQKSQIAKTEPEAVTVRASCGESGQAL